MTPPQPRSTGFMLACGLAYVGGVIGYLPLLALLLPAQVVRIAGAERFGVLALILVVGAFAAAASNVMFGWLSDRSCRRGGGRRRWIAAGLAVTLVTFALIPAAQTPAALLAAIALFQIALNAALAPMMALFADEIPEAQTGLTTGMFAAGPLIASLVSLGLATSALTSLAGRLAVIGLAMAGCFAPLLATRALATRARILEPAARPAEAMPPRHDLALAWIARLLMQVAGAVLFADLLYLMAEPSAPVDGRAAMLWGGSLLLLANLVPLPLALLFGRWSDRIHRRKPLLLAASAIAASGLVAMAVVPGWTGRALAFLIFSAGWGAFLPLQVGSIMRLLPDPQWRGRDLGIVNLANTLPVLLGQALAWMMATPRSVTALLLTLAALTLAGGITMLGVRGGR